MSKLGLLVGIETLASQGVQRVTLMAQLYKIMLYQNIACSAMIRYERLRPPKGTLLRRCYPITIFVNCPLISLIGSSQLELARNVHPYALTTALMEWTP